MSLAYLVLGMLVFGGTAGALSRPYGKQLLDPYSRRSPSRVWVLEVDPSTNVGAGGGLYRMMRSGKEAWSATLPYTLWDAEVADDGSLAGYAYTTGLEGRESNGGKGELRLVILDPEGKPRLDQALSRTERKHPHIHPHPTATGILLDHQGNRVVFRVEHMVSRERREETWTSFELSTGEPIASFEPKRQLAEITTQLYLVAARPVPETTLTLCQWYSYKFGGECGARFVLVDIGGQPVWTLDLPHDYSSQPDEIAERIKDRVLERSAILQVGEAGRFELALVAEAKRAAFEVSEDRQAPLGWKVTELVRADYVFLIEEGPPSEVLVSKPLSIELLGVIELEDTGARAEPDIQRLDNIQFAFVDHLGRILLVDYRDKAVHVFDREGRRISVLAPEPDLADGYVAHMAVAGDGTIHLAGPLGGRYRHVAFSPTGEWLGEQDLRGKSYFKPGKNERWSVDYDEIDQVDAQGAILRHIERKADRTWFGQILTAAVAPDGSLAVVDSRSTSDLSIFSPDGEAVLSTDCPYDAGMTRPAFGEGRIFSWSGNTLYCFELATRTLRSATLGPDLVKEFISQPFWDARSKELWLFDWDERRFVRYRVGE